MSILNENDVYQNAEQSIIDKLMKQIQDELVKKADLVLLNYHQDRISYLLEENNSLRCQLLEMQDKIRGMESQLNNCLKLDNLMYGNDYYRNETRDVWCAPSDSTNQTQYDVAGT